MKLLNFAVSLYYIFCFSLFSMDPPPISAPIASENIVRLVFMGKTGAGKSTSINTFYNHVKDVKPEDFPKLFPIKTKFQACNVKEYALRNAEDHTNGQLDAVTQEPSEYTASGSNLVVNLIDCPGMADPRGVQKDAENSAEIAKFLNKVGAFNAICIVLKGSMNRATPEEKYFVEQIKTIIPKSSQNRIFIVLTHTTRASQNAKDFAASVELPVDNVFAFENFALTQEGHLDPTTDDDGTLMADVNRTWSSSRNAFNRLIAKAKELGAYSTAEIERIVEIKAKATEKINKALRSVKQIEETEIKLKDARYKLEDARAAQERALSSKDSADAALKRAEADKNAKMALCTYETYYETQPEKTDYLNTFCTNCGINCHEPCGLEDKGPYYNDHISGCTCMKDGCCTHCPGKCSYTKHFHRDQRFVQVQRTRDLAHIKDQQTSAVKHVNEMSRILTEKQQSLNDATNKKEDKNNEFIVIDTCLANLKKERTELQNQIVELYLELDKVSMCSIVFHIGEYYDALIKEEKDTVKRAVLERDRRFYVEQVELYKQRKK